MTTPFSAEQSSDDGSLGQRRILRVWGIAQSAFPSDWRGFSRKSVRPSGNGQPIGQRQIQTGPARELPGLIRKPNKIKTRICEMKLCQPGRFPQRIMERYGKGRQRSKAQFQLQSLSDCHRVSYYISLPRPRRNRRNRIPPEPCGSDRGSSLRSQTCSPRWRTDSGARRSGWRP